MVMQSLRRGAGIAALLALSATCQATALTYDFSYAFGSSADVISGSFTGTASGNLITNLSNVTATFDGVPLGGGGTLYNAGLDLGTGFWVNDAAVVSFDGSQNNLLFSNSPDPNSLDPSDFFLSINNAVLSATFASVDNGAAIAIDSEFNTAGWSVRAESVPEPATLSLLGLGLAGVGFMRRRKAA